MCIETQSLATALLPKFASDIGYNVQLLQLISAYQKNPGTETYQAVQKFLVKQRKEKQTILDTFYDGKQFNRIDLNIIDYEDNLLWSTAPLKNQDKIVLLYQASEYSPQATQGSAFKQFETGEKYTLSWVSGSSLFPKGGALRIGFNSYTEPPCTGCYIDENGDCDIVVCSTNAECAEGASCLDEAYCGCLSCSSGGCCACPTGTTCNDQGVCVTNS
jgi:hypothetical protein